MMFLSYYGKTTFVKDDKSVIWPFEFVVNKSTLKTNNTDEAYSDPLKGLCFMSSKHAEK